MVSWGSKGAACTKTVGGGGSINTTTADLVIWGVTQSHKKSVFLIGPRCCPKAVVTGDGVWAVGGPVGGGVGANVGGVMKQPVHLFCYSEVNHAASLAQWLSSHG